ncbi:MAG: cytochrome P450 [Fulvivirga sp.]
MSLWKPLDPENIANPYEMYRVLRETAPIYKAQTGEWILTGYEDVRHVLTSKLFLSGNRMNWIKKEQSYLANKGIDLKAIIAAMDKFILQLDPPAHTKLRKFILENWKNKDVEHIIYQNIERATNDFSGNTIDLQEELTGKLPAMNAAAILGLPSNDYAKLHEMASHMIIALDLYVNLKELVRLNEAAQEFIDYFKQLIRSKQYNDGLLANLIEANEHSAEPLNESELISLAIFIFVAGEETSVSFVSSGLYNLLKYDMFKEVASFDNYPAVVEELLRYDPPVQLLGRLASKDCVINGTQITAGDTLTLAIAAANRDPAHCDQPDKINFHRDPNRHLAFGQGIHYCLGDWLARQTSQLAFQHCVEHYPNMHLTEQSVEWNKNLAIRSLKSLQVQLT